VSRTATNTLTWPCVKNNTSPITPKGKKLTHTHTTHSLLSEGYEEIVCLKDAFEILEV